LIKSHLTSWKKAFKKDHLRIKIQNKWFDDFKNTDLYQAQKKYKRLRSTFTFIDYLILSGLFLVVYSTPVSEINALFGSQLSQELYQLIVLNYTIFIFILALFIVLFLLNDKRKANHTFKNIMKVGLFGGLNALLLAFSFVIQPAYLLIFTGLLVVKVVLRRWKDLQLEVVKEAYMKATQDNLIRHYKSKGIVFELLDEPQIRRIDIDQETYIKEEF